MLRFDVQDLSYRNPTGAVTCGQTITLRLHADRCKITRSELVVVDDTEGTTSIIPMSWFDLYGDMDVYECQLNTAKHPGILWYYFCAYTFYEDPIYLGCDGEHDDVPQAFQLTVYHPCMHTPEWFADGVTYHIFVDRFYRSEDSAQLSHDADFFVHTNMHNLPHFRPNANGEIENRDIFGGDLRGIKDQLPYLESLGVTTLYLSPIFEAWSNHKYNTADYLKIDSHFGDEDDLCALCDAAKAHGMHVILDGVFNHTGSDSIYFNKNGRYDSVGAFQSIDSLYRKWYSFTQDGSYDTWWGIKTLPAVNEMEEGFRALIAQAVYKWMACGVSGWRLDVADELPDTFLAELHEMIKKQNENALVIGEVWEDASNKVAYGVRKKYFTDMELDSVMNYPLKNAILGFLIGEIDAEGAAWIMNRLCEHYPAQALQCLMNIIGTHDTVRVLTVLGLPPGNLSREEKARFRLDRKARAVAVKRLFAAAVFQFVFPGSPCIYYGDEVGCQGFEDPFNREFFPWWNKDEEILGFYRKLGQFRGKSIALCRGSFRVLYASGDVLVLLREYEGERVIAAYNRSMKKQTIYLQLNGVYYDVLETNCVKSRLGWLKLCVSSNQIKLLTNRQDLQYNIVNH